MSTKYLLPWSSWNHQFYSLKIPIKVITNGWILSLHKLLIANMSKSVTVQCSKAITYCSLTVLFFPPKPLFFFRLWTMPTSRALPPRTLNLKIKRPLFYPISITLTTTPSLWIHTAGPWMPWRFRTCRIFGHASLKGYIHISHMPYFSVHNHLTIYTPAPGHPILK